MDDRDVVTPEALWGVVEGDLRAMIAGVAAAVTQAPRGQWIAASEERVRDLLAQARQRVYQAALQMKVKAAEGAFSPSEAGPRQRPQ
jgi:hypothetical protein